jgi:phage tail-like protein
MTDPARKFRFRVEVDGITRAAFSEVSGFDSTTDVIEYREGTDAPHVRKIPGMTKFGDLTLKWGLLDDMELFTWRQDVIDGKDVRKTVYVVALDETGGELARWQCLRAWPSNVDPPDFNAKGNDLAITALKISCEEVKRTR